MNTTQSKGLHKKVHRFAYVHEKLLPVFLACVMATMMISPAALMAFAEEVAGVMGEAPLEPAVSEVIEEPAVPEPAAPEPAAPEPEVVDVVEPAFEEAEALVDGLDDEGALVEELDEVLLGAPVATSEGEDAAEEGTLRVIYDSNWWPALPAPTDDNFYSPGDTVTVLFDPIPEAEGFWFLGWDTDPYVYGDEAVASYSEAGVTTFEIYEETFLYAVWGFEPLDIEIMPLAEGDTYTVTFYTGEGSDDSDRVYLDIEEGTLLGDIEGVSDDAPKAKEGWKFTGWDPAITLDTPVESDLEFTAQWTPVYAVIFVDWNGNLLDIQEVEPGDDAIAPSYSGSRDGYTFIGWDTDFTNVSSDLYVTAQYDLITYLITYNPNGGTNHPSNPKTYTIEDTPIWFYPPTRNNYEFIGWEGVGFSVPGGTTGNLTLTAMWVLNESGQASFPDGDYTIVIGRTTNKGGPGDGQFFVLVKDKEGHTIDAALGLNGPSGTETFTFYGGGYEIVVTIKGNNIIGAEGVITAYPVRFEPGTWGSFPSTVVVYLVSGEPMPAPPDNYRVPSVPEYTFTGWLDDGGIFYPDGTSLPRTVTGGVTFTAQWEADPDIPISYTTDGNGTVSLDSEKVHPYSGKPEGSTAIANPGYTFSHWESTLPDDITPLDDETIVPVKNGHLYQEVTYTAIFAIDNDQTYTIKYEADDPAMGSVAPTSETNQVLTAATGSTAIPETGYKFVKWTDEDGDTVSEDKAFTPDATLRSDATFTAHFDIDKDQEYTITYRADDEDWGSVDPGSETNQVLTAATGSTATPKPGYKFVNWTDEDGVEVGVTETFVPDPDLRKDAEFTANFAPNEYTITYDIVNGTWDENNSTTITETVTHGNKLAEIPTPVADAGYTQNSGAWDAPAPDDSVAVTANATYTYRFTTLNTYKVTYALDTDSEAPATHSSLPTEKQYQVGSNVTVEG
ncbi:MAG: InlB B-repeat-containing protein, partial [Eggerthellaceae bacterium]|nr:InlB B-repeat-containing protein [Eggerthellaceae bacterium]